MEDTTRRNFFKAAAISALGVAGVAIPSNAFAFALDGWDMRTRAEIWLPRDENDKLAQSLAFRFNLLHMIGKRTGYAFYNKTVEEYPHLVHDFHYWILRISLPGIKIVRDKAELDELLKK